MLSMVVVLTLLDITFGLAKETIPEVAAVVTRATINATLLEAGSSTLCCIVACFIFSLWPFREVLGLGFCCCDLCCMCSALESACIIPLRHSTLLLLDVPVKTGQYDKHKHIMSPACLRYARSSSAPVCVRKEHVATKAIGCVNRKWHNLTLPWPARCSVACCLPV